MTVLLLHARSYWPFFPDDSFISLRYSERLLNGQGLTWTDGERVEGYSNLLWVLLVAAAGWVEPDLVRAARGLGLCCMALAQAAMFHLAFRRPNPVAIAFATFAALLLAAAGPIAAWSTAGLEQPLLAALLAWSFVLCGTLTEPGASPSQYRTGLASFLLGLLCLVRPDGPLFTVAAGLGVWVAHGLRLRSLGLVMRLALWPIALTLGQLAFRVYYYDAWVPNTYYVKGGFSWKRIGDGLAYLQDSLWPLCGAWAAVGLAALCVPFDRIARARMAAPLLAALLWIAYVIRIGGDIISQRRHLVPLITLGALLLLLLLHRIWEARGGRLRWLAFVVGPSLLAALVIGQRDDPQRRRALSDDWHWTGQPVGNLLRLAFAREQPLLAVDAAGALPYYYRGPCLDMLGLSDRYLATHPPADIGTKYIGHELGDGSYVASRKPDLIAFWTPIGGPRSPWRSGSELSRLPEFQRLYQLVTFLADGPKPVSTRLWVRARDSRIGIREQPDRVIVPGYLLTGSARSPVRMDAAARLYAVATASSPLRISQLELSEGLWRVDLDGEGEPRITIRSSTESQELARGESFRLEKSSGIDGVSVQLDVSGPGYVAVRQLVFSRTTSKPAD